MSGNTQLQEQAAEVGRVLSAISNERRLLILCHLQQQGETPVSGLVRITGLSQSALSQHLALMRHEGLVRARKDGLIVFYSVADSRIQSLMASLEAIFCPADNI